MLEEKVINESGLEWELVKEGTGDKPTLGQTTLVHYEIWFGDGVSTSNFDYDKSEYVDVLYDTTRDEKNPFHGPVEFKIGEHTPLDDTYKKGQSIAGLDEALLDMKVGEVRNLHIPSDLAYGELGGSSFHTFHAYRTPPNSPLKMRIELVKIGE
tara:strand:+ start:106 stop:567 length:462 start_codon:yes stop_codon:yes gene_type:complete